MPHRCRRCNEGATVDKPLFGCVRCGRHYHSACHRPHPREPSSNWVCKRCLAAAHKGGLAKGHATGGLGQPHQRRYPHYHDQSLPPPLPLSLSQSSPLPSSSSPSPWAAAHSSSSSAALPPPPPGIPHDHSRRAATTMASLAAAPPAVIGLAPPPSPASIPNGPPRLPGDLPGPIIRCSYGSCLAKIDGGRQVVCDIHLQTMAVADRPRDPARPNGTHPAPPKAPAAAAATLGPPPRLSHQLPPLRKLLPDTDRDRPILRRKTAGNPPQFVPQQPTPKHSTPSSRGGSATSPRSPRPLAPRPVVSAPLPGPVHSPPLSPGSLRNVEPARKRQRRSPSPSQPLKVHANGTAAAPSRPSTTESDLENKAVGVTSPHSSRHALNQSPLQRPAVKPEAKPWPKPSFKHPVKRIPLQVSNLRFIDSPDDCAPGMLSEQSSFAVNGFAGNFPRRSSWASTASTSSDVPLRETRKARISNPAPPVSRDPPTEPASHARKPSREVPIRHRQKPPPEKAKPKAQSGFGPFQATGGDSSKQKDHTTIKPAKIIDPVYPLLPKPKEIDVDRFDALIYAQSGAASPPPDIALPSLPALFAKKRAAIKPRNLPTDEEEDEPIEPEPLYLPIDPRVHWPQSHSRAWHAAKQKEIHKRGGRKANFGRAAKSLQRQRKLQASHAADDAALPENIAENPAWVRALRQLGELAPSSSSSGSVGGEGAASSVEGEGEGENEGGMVGRRTRRGTGNGNGVSGTVTSKRIGKSGLVVVCGLTEAQFEMMERREEA